jgi:hypothetical protein
MWKITFGPDRGVYLEEELNLTELLHAPKGSWDARIREHATRRLDSKTPLGRYSGDGRDTVQIAGLEGCFGGSSDAEQNPIRLWESC